jgi:hypothetical protein
MSIGSNLLLLIHHFLLIVLLSSVGVMSASFASTQAAGYLGPYILSHTRSSPDGQLCGLVFSI